MDYREHVYAPVRGGAAFGVPRPRLLVRDLVLILFLAVAAAAEPASAQFLSESPPPVPPAAVPVPPPGPAMNLAPATGPGATPSAPAAPHVPGASMLNPGTAAPGAPARSAGQGVLALTVRFGKGGAVVPAGVHWRIYADKPDANGALRLVREERAASPEVVLPPGTYVVHCAVGMASQTRRVTVYQDTTRETFDLAAGGLRIEGRVGTSPIPKSQVSFDIYKGSQFETAERAPIAQNVQAGSIIVVPQGIYYIISNYGDGNSAVRSDIRVTAGKLTDVTVQHRAAVITLKLVADRGGEALANTSWSVITPGGDLIKEMSGAFPSIVLAEGEYRAIARNEGRTYEHGFNVVTGVDGEVEVSVRTSMRLPR